MASVHALPVELLARIFFLGVSDDPDPDHQVPGEPTFEVVVSHVCHYWRAVAVRTPPLWTTIHFRTHPHLHRARHYVARSTCHPLHIHVDTCTEADYHPGHLLFRDEFLPLFNIVIPHINRWRSLVLKVRDLTCKAHARTVLSQCGAAPNLHFLQLWHIEEWGSPERLYTAIGPPPVVVFAGRLPSLRDLSLIGVNLPWAQSLFLHHLHSLELALHSDDVRIPFALWHDMLTKSPGLTRLSLTYSGPRAKAGPWALSAPIVLPALTHLRLTDLDPPYLCALLRSIHAPALRSLFLELSEQDFTPFVRMLAAPPPPDTGQDLSLDPTALPPDPDPAPADPDAPPPPALLPALDTLAVAALDCTPTSWRALLASVPALRVLDADFARAPPGAFAALLDAPPLLPALHTLRVAGVSGAQLRALADARAAAACPLRAWEVSLRAQDEDALALAQSVVEGREARWEWFQDEDEDEDDEDEDEQGEEEEQGEDDDDEGGGGEGDEAEGPQE